MKAASLRTILTSRTVLAFCATLFIQPLLIEIATATAKVYFLSLALFMINSWLYLLFCEKILVRLLKKYTSNKWLYVLCSLLIVFGFYYIVVVITVAMVYFGWLALATHYGWPISAGDLI